MDTTTLLIIILLLVLLFGGGFYGRGRWWQKGAWPKPTPDQLGDASYRGVTKQSSAREMLDPNVEFRFHPSRLAVPKPSEDWPVVSELVQHRLEGITVFPLEGDERGSGIGQGAAL